MNDTLVIGAGAAGLAAAAHLAAQGRPVRVLEARDRIGGRCFSVAGDASRRLTGCPPELPAELGAEFVHGEAQGTAQIMRRHAIVAIDAAEERWLMRDRRLEPAQDAFEEMVRAFRRARSRWLRRGDEAFADFLARFGERELSPRARQLALRLVEGFDAADPARVSAREIVEEWTSASVLGERQGRPLGGYGAICGALAGELAASGVEIQLRTVVRRIQWRRGGVIVEAVSGAGARRVARSYRARHAIVTVPLGVLQRPVGEEGAIEFDPPLRSKRAALESLAPGPVVKLVLEFAQPFWEEAAGGRYRNAAFLLAPGRRFPTFWTGLPLRIPRIVAWAGGPQAAALAGLDRDALADIAVADLLAILDCAPSRARALRSVHFHDWQADPFSRGAYSYVTVGGSSARRRLASPLAHTLFFAGEATDWRGEAATVSGAIASGERAARATLRKASRRGS